jgi:hypothetical protein
LDLAKQINRTNEQTKPTNKLKRTTKLTMSSPHCEIQNASKKLIDDLNSLINDMVIVEEMPVEMPDDRSFIITPIAKKYKKEGPDSKKDYEEQIQRDLAGELVMWDDTKRNSSKIGDYFGFYRYKKHVSIRIINEIKNPYQRLETWSQNVGQGERNVLILSDEIIKIDWDKWIELEGAKRCMGTQAVKKNIDVIKRYINTH